MALLNIVLKKMLKNIWFMLFVLFALLIATGLISSIPMYNSAASSAALKRDINNSTLAQGKQPGGFYVSVKSQYTFESALLTSITKNSAFDNDKVKELYASRKKEFLNVEQKVDKDLIKNNNVPYLTKVEKLSTNGNILTLKNSNSENSEYPLIEAMSDLEKHISIISGRLPSKDKVNDVFEVIVTEDAYETLNLKLNETYTINDTKAHRFKAIKVKPVGIFDAKSNSDLYFDRFNINGLKQSLLINYDLMQKEFMNNGYVRVSDIYLYYILDFNRMSARDLVNLSDQCSNLRHTLLSIDSTINMELNSQSAFNDYSNSSAKLTTTLLGLNVPCIIILIIFFFMISTLLMEKEKNEIAVMASRGASSRQILIIYLIQTLILGTVAFILGPFIGILFCKFIGASSGFLQFVNRKGLDASLSLRAFQYSFLSVLLFIITVLIPAMKTSKISIVNFKRAKGRTSNSSLWKKFFLDFILLVICIYEYNAFNKQQSLLQHTQLTSSMMSSNFLLFVMPVLFIVAVTLIFLRFYPYIVNLIYMLGKKHWPPTVYSTLLQVQRGIKNYHFIMIFLCLTVAMGIYSASAARTINANNEDKISYSVGTDLIINSRWDVIESDEAGASTSVIEPPFSMYENLKGVQNAAKVYRNDTINAEYNGANIPNANLMAIEPAEFSKVVWYRNGLLPAHINTYLNLLTDDVSACLISKSMADSNYIKPGDSITVQWKDNSPLSLTVYGVVDYWPGWNPYSTENNQTMDNLIIANLPYVQSMTSLEPYDVWAKLKPGVKSSDIYAAIKNSKINLMGLTDKSQQLIAMKNDGTDLAINGSLTVGFLVNLGICFMAFILYWVILIKQRSLQFGIIRALGVTSEKLKRMMSLEQLLTSGVSMIIGVILGLVTSLLYVPFFQMSQSSVDQLIPFVVVSSASDKIKVYIFIIIALVICLTIINYIISKIKIASVLKLGED